MKAKYILFFLFLFARSSFSFAQEIVVKDSIIAYNKHRLKVDFAGTRPLAIWGLSNIAVGTVGYFTARQDEWKYFHQMNAMVGVVNTGIAAINLAMVNKQMADELNYRLYYEHYLADKRRYLTYIGVDLLFLGAGTWLNESSKTNTENAAQYRGFGRSLVIQGAARILFDNIMFSAHLRYNVRWWKIIDEMRFTGNGLGFSCNL